MRGIARTQAGKLSGQRINKREAAVLGFAKQVAIVEYNFSNDGGAVGTYSCNISLPSNSVVTNVYSNELTAFTSGGAATVQVQCASTNLTDALAFDTGFSGAQAQALASSATAIACSGEIKIAVAAAALTAGRCKFAIEYYVQ